MMLHPGLFRWKLRMPEFFLPPFLQGRKMVGPALHYRRVHGRRLSMTCMEGIETDKEIAGHDPEIGEGFFFTACRESFRRQKRDA